MKPITLPPVERCAAAMPDPDLLGGGTDPILTVQLNTLGGQIYLVPLSVLAAKTLMAALASWQPMQDYLLGQELPEPPKLQ